MSRINYLENLFHWGERWLSLLPAVLKQVSAPLVKSRVFANKEDIVKLLANNIETAGVSNVHKNVWGFNSRGAHVNKSINREDADFSLLTTHTLERAR